MVFAPNIDAALLFIIFVFPGMVSMRIYRLMMPAREVDWKDAIVEAFFFSAVNFAVFLPVIALIGGEDFPKSHPIYFSLALMSLLLVGPILLPYLFVKLQRCQWLMQGLQLPHPTAWDFYFDKRDKCFALIHLKDNKYVGGLFSSRSFASAFPRHGDIYLEQVYKVDDKGNFIEAIEGSNGIIVRSEDYTIIEFFDIPQTSIQKTDTKELCHDRQDPQAGVTPAG